MRRSHVSYITRLTNITKDSNHLPSFSLWTKGIGLELFLCPMESLVMDYFWDNYPFPTPISKIQRLMKNDGHYRAYTTVSTVTRRLAVKSMLKIDRTVDRKKYYTPVMRRDEFIKYAISSVIESIACNYEDIMNQVLEERDGSHIRHR